MELMENNVLENTEVILKSLDLSDFEDMEEIVTPGFFGVIICC